MCVASVRIYCLRELGTGAEENDSLEKVVAAFFLSLKSVYSQAK